MMIEKKLTPGLSKLGHIVYRKVFQGFLKVNTVELREEYMQY